jgi:hypothetical protein
MRISVSGLWKGHPPSYRLPLALVQELPCDFDQMSAVQLRDLTAALIKTINQQDPRAALYEGEPQARSKSSMSAPVGDSRGHLGG